MKALLIVLSLGLVAATSDEQLARCLAKRGTFAEMQRLESVGRKAEAKRRLVRDIEHCKRWRY